MASKIRGLFITINQIIKFATRTGKVVAENTIIEKRVGICQFCEFLHGSKCEHCGCNIPIKIGLIDAECPIKKW